LIIVAATEFSGIAAPFSGVSAARVERKTVSLHKESASHAGKYQTEGSLDCEMMRTARGGIAGGDFENRCSATKSIANCAGIGPEVSSW
jgi:hypothetical protein